jgi:hypothetical protein
MIQARMMGMQLVLHDGDGIGYSFDGVHCYLNGLGTCIKLLEHLPRL